MQVGSGSSGAQFLQQMTQVLQQAQSSAYARLQKAQSEAQAQTQSVRETALELAQLRQKSTSIDLYA